MNLIKSGINTFIYVTDGNEKENVKDKNVAWLTSSAEIAKKCRYRCYLFTQSSVVAYVVEPRNSLLERLTPQ